MKRIAVAKTYPKELVALAAKALKAGKVLILPTDTVYGLVADAMNKKAVRKVFLIKGRQQGKPLPIFIRNIAVAKKLARVSRAQERYMRNAWPGKVTIVLASKGVLPRETGTADLIGLRIPKHPLLKKILEAAKIPLTGTSANRALSPSLTDGKEATAVFQRGKYKPDIIFDAGRLAFSRPSKVVDVTRTKPVVLRK